MRRNEADRATATLGMLLAMFAVTSSGASRSPAQDIQNDPSQLLLNAAKASDLRAEGQTPFQLSAHVSITDPQGKDQNGTYLLIWISTTKWHEEIKFPGYQQIRFGGENKYWQVRSADYEPEAVNFLIGMVEMTEELRHVAKEKNWKAGTKKFEGIAADCVEPPVKGNREEMCFYRDNHALFREDDLSGGISAREYKDYRQFGSVLFPRTMTSFAGSKPVIALTVDQLTPFSMTDSPLFNPPPSAEMWETCGENELGPQFVSQKLPRTVYTGAFRIYGVIETDGTLQHIRVLEPPDPAVSAAFMDTLRTWRFRPATCDGSPIRTEFYQTLVIGKRHPPL